MNAPSSYAVADFIPFTADVYFRLIERVSEAWWPLHPLALGVGVAAAMLAMVGRVRAAASLLAVALAWVGVTFLIGAYAQLNWAGVWFGRVFVIEAALLLLFVFTRPRGHKTSWRGSGSESAGLALLVLGILVYPLIAPLAGYGWSRAEVFGIHPDPTAVAALGIALLILRGWRLWLVCVIPMLWCLFSALTLQVLQAPWAGILYAALAAAVLGVVWQSAAGAGRGNA